MKYNICQRPFYVFLDHNIIFISKYMSTNIEENEVQIIYILLCVLETDFFGRSP